MSRSDSQGEQFSQLQTMPSTMTDSSSALGDALQLHKNTESSRWVSGDDPCVAVEGTHEP